MAVKAYNTITLISIDDGLDGRGVVSIVEEYAKSTSSTVPPSTGWTTQRPVFDIETDLDKYLWIQLKTTYNSPPTEVYSAALLDLAWGLRERVADGVGQVASLGESLDNITETLGRIDTEQRITALDRLALQAEYDRIRTESSHLALILADVDDSMFDGYEGAISEYDTAATEVLEWLAYATDAPNFSDVDTSEWGDLQTDYLMSLDRVNQLAQAVKTQHDATLTSQMLSFEQVQGQFQERLKIDAQGMTINVDDENALTIRNDGMRISVEGVERAEFTSSGFSADQGRVDVLQVGAHIVSRDGDFTVWRPI